MVAVGEDIRRGAYYDSVVLMQLQRSLAALPRILDAGVVMGTDANKNVLAQSDLLTPGAKAAAADDRRQVGSGQHAAYRPKSIESALQMMPQAQWVLISVPGRYAAGVARQALRLGRNVFLYSDNVTVEEESALKRMAAQSGRLVMGPDCGTAIINGIGLGFANQVRRGPIGLIGASGTGLQQVSCRIHQLGSGITHALGTGGRDLSSEAGAVTTFQGLDLLSRDPATRVIVLISKPPSPPIVDGLLAAARLTGKPVVVDFIGYVGRRRGNVHLTTTLDKTAELAVELAAVKTDVEPAPDLNLERFASGQRYLRGLFSGGTLAYEAMLVLQDYIPAVYSNAPLDSSCRLTNSLVSQADTVIDLGEDEFTVGRLHPMMDNDLRIRRLQQEAADPEVAVILLDIVLACQRTGSCHRWRACPGRTGGTTLGGGNRSGWYRRGPARPGK